MTVVWVILAAFTASVLLARWQFSETRAICMFVWYQRWRMRERKRNLSIWFWKRFPRLMDFRWRVLRPWYRIRNHDLVWKIQFKIEHAWFIYACFWVPKCKNHPKTALLDGGTCPLCMVEKAFKEAERKKRLNVLTGKA
jgi:hypothetical protein